MGTIVLNRFELGEKLGKGHFGTVFRAYDQVLREDVALKEFALRRDESASSLFNREMQFLRQLDHPYLVKVHELFLDEGSGKHYLSEELVRGPSLSEYLAGADWNARVGTFVMILQGLEYLHQRGIVHLDIKPSNVLVALSDEAGMTPRPKILDFGIADEIHRTSGKRYTAGTFPYMAPEVARGDPPDGRADLYSLAMTYLEAFSAEAQNSEPRGSRAADGGRDRTVPSKDISQLIRETAERRQPLLSDLRPDVPRPLAQILLTLLHPDPTRRFWSANAVIQRINQTFVEAYRLEPGRMRVPDKLTAVRLGRSKELPVILGWLDAFSASRSPVFVGGLWGGGQSGKSALLDELRQQAEMRDERVVRLDRAQAGVDELFARMRGFAPAGVLAPYARFLQGIVPGLPREGNDPLEMAGDPMLGQKCVLDRRAEAFGAMLGGRRVVLLVDDLDQKADVAELLRQFIMFGSSGGGGQNPAERGRLFLMFAARSGAQNPLPLLEDERLELRNWSPEEAAQVVRDLTGLDRPPDGLVTALMEKTEGIPGLLVEHLKALLDVSLAAGSDPATALGAPDVSASAAVLDVEAEWRRRLEELSKTERTVLNWICTSPLPLGRDDLELVDLMLFDLPERALRRLKDAGWVVQDGETARPAGEMRRETVLSQIPEPQRRWMCLHLAERWPQLSLASPERAGGDGGALQRAGLYLLAGEPERAFTFAKPVVESLIALHHPEPALPFLRMCAAAAQDLGSTERLALQRLLAHAQLSRADYPAAIQSFIAALGEAHAPRDRANLSVGLARSYRYGGDLEAAMDTIGKAKAGLEEGSHHRAALDALLADILLERGRYDDAAGTSAPYLSGEIPCGALESLLFRHVAGKVEFFKGHFDAAADLLRRNCDESRRLGHSALHALAQSALGVVYLHQDRLDDASLQFHSCATLSADIGDLRTTALANVNLGVVHQRKGALDESARFYEKALALFRRISDRVNEARTRYNLAVLRSRMGDLEGADNDLVDCLGVCGELALRHLEANARLARADVAMARGDPARAAEECDRALDRFRELNMPRDALMARLRRLMIAAENGDEARVERELPDCEQEGKTYASPHLSAWVFYLQATLALRSNRDRARELLQESLACLDRLDPTDEELKKRVLAGMAAREARSAAQIQGTDSPGSLGLAHEGTVSLSDRAQEVSGGTVLLEERGSEASRVARGDATSVERLTVLRRLRADDIRMIDLIRKINEPVEIQEVLKDVVDVVLELTEAEFGFLLLQEEGALSIRAARIGGGRNADPAEAGMSLSVARDVVTDGRAILCVDASRDDRFQERESIRRFHIRSALCLPLKVGDRTVGVLYLDTRTKPCPFKVLDLPALEAIAGLAAVSVQKARLMAQSLRDREDLRKTVDELRTSKTTIEDLNRQLEEANARLQQTVVSQQEEIEKARRQLDVLVQRDQLKYAYDRIVGTGPGIRKALSMADRAVESRMPVLLLGESGTGKELFARAIHFNSARKAHPFVPVNCSAIPPDLFESELFGHVKGAFTSADRAKAGLFEAAHQGTLFLDEIGEMPLPLQAKLLRVLQDGSFRPLGGTKELTADVRIIAATNRDLAEMVRSKRFREDLYYRLRVFRIPIPPLRERRDDLPVLAEYLMKQIAREESGPIRQLSDPALRLLKSYAWPGNVRELENTLRSAYAMSQGDVIEVKDLAVAEELFPSDAMEVRQPGEGYRALLKRFQKKLLEDALARHGGNVAAAARDLGVDRTQLAHWIRRMKLRGGRGQGTASPAAK